MSIKFEVNGKDYMRVDGIWFVYINEQYIMAAEYDKLETLYQQQREIKNV